DFGHGGHVDADHCFTKTATHTGDDVRVIVVRGGFDNSFGTLGRIAALEDAAAYEHTIHTQLHHQGSIGGGGDPTSGKVHHRKTAFAGNFCYQMIGRTNILSVGHPF